MYAAIFANENKKNVQTSRQHLMLLFIDKHLIKWKNRKLDAAYTAVEWP